MACRGRLKDGRRDCRSNILMKSSIISEGMWDSVIQMEDARSLLEITGEGLPKRGDSYCC
jgi:hypothetical protein